MIIRWILSAIFFCFVSSPVYALNNPFEKKEVVDIGTNAIWHIKDGFAVKTGEGKKGRYFQLIFNKKQLQLVITKDTDGKQAEHFSQLAIVDMLIDDVQQPLFRWCLNHQQNQHRFLQQGLSVQDDVCLVDGDQGMFTINLNRKILATLEQGRHLVLVVRPYRTRIELDYDLSDFKAMTTALLHKSTPVVNKKIIASLPRAVKAKSAEKQKKCWAGPPANYADIKTIEYNCNDLDAEQEARSTIAGRVSTERKKQEKLKASQERKKHELDAKRKKEEVLRKQQQQQAEAEAVAIAASKTKQAEISNEITIKMVGMCKKIWDKGENRCYCQKYIEYAPADIRANSTCK